ncbi:hypothetical protein PHJA_002219700 [Phtheirospermum japonicum]|uniref:Uncharacterized protein n=1 Tax=Phtheirospermum japonicum TaxID=374723 RepID=A0A830CJB5_9LAMI|nr:hypothetical protein PHJA_002219700 [Phtheirospermum japonicum]
MDRADGSVQDTRIGAKASPSAARRRHPGSLESGKTKSCHVTSSFLTVVILGVGLSAKPDLIIETWAQQKALERLEIEAAQSVESD